jgi:dimethylamine/trimethylamine dehydrogenase
MNKNPYSRLFEAVQIGPVVTKNRFYQVPHCCGMGHVRPRAHAAMRGVKAKGGWGVVSTEEAEIHPSSDLAPYAEQRIWDKNDIPALQMMTDAVHEHGALAAIELTHSGHNSTNLFSRIPAMSPNAQAVNFLYPKQARRMTKKDISDFRAWHKQAALNAKEAGFDIIYVYAGHGMSVAQQFILPDMNNRSDEYGGSLENRLRLTRELLEETREAIGDSCGIAFRFAVDELKGNDGMQFEEEGCAVVELLAEHPDLWDVNVSDWSNDSQTSRFQPDEAYQMPYVEFVKNITTKPVVGVGRLTSPDLMVRLVEQGVLDLIGAARPSIADPYLPNKIKEQKTDQIKECIGCNICVSSDNFSVPIRCTQNPTMGEEWRRGWDPENIKPKITDQKALVVGSGPSGLECTVQLARRGYQVILAEAKNKLGGRVLFESNLKGLSNWKRVVDNRTHEILQNNNIEVYKESKLTAELIGGLGINNIFLATGSSWRKDGIGRSRRSPIQGLESIQVYSPEEVVQNLQDIKGPLVVYDDEQGYLAGVLADHLSSEKAEIIFVTPASVISPWTDSTLEQKRVQASLINAGVKIICNQSINKIENETAFLECVFSGSITKLHCESIVMVTERISDTALYDSLIQNNLEGKTHYNIKIIGDAEAPGLIADAVYLGHLAAQNFEASDADIQRGMFMREMPSLK